MLMMMGQDPVENNDDLVESQVLLGDRSHTTPTTLFSQSLFSMLKQKPGFKHTNSLTLTLQLNLLRNKASKPAEMRKEIKRVIELISGALDAPS